VPVRERLEVQELLWKKQQRIVTPARAMALLSVMRSERAERAGKRRPAPPARVRVPPPYA